MSGIFRLLTFLGTDYQEMVGQILLRVRGYVFESETKRSFSERIWMNCRCQEIYGGEDLNYSMEID